MARPLHCFRNLPENPELERPGMPLAGPFFSPRLIQKSLWPRDLPVLGKSGTVVAPHRLLDFTHEQAAVSVADVRGSDFYRQRADDMRRQADRALSPHLRETYLRIAGDWEHMAEDVLAKESRCGRAH